MEIATFSNLKEANFVLDLINKHSYLTDLYYHVGGITTVAKSKKDWFWVTTGEHIDYELPFSPGQPDNSLGVEFCLNIHRTQGNEPNYFNDCPCAASFTEVKFPAYSFMCQQKIVYQHCSKEIVWIIQKCDKKIGWVLRLLSITKSRRKIFILTMLSLGSGYKSFKFIKKPNQNLVAHWGSWESKKRNLYVSNIYCH